LIAGNQNAYLVKRNSGGGVRFSRDPFNLTNKHSRKQAGFINGKAVSVQPNDKGGVTLSTKKSGNANQPASHLNTHAYKSTSSNRK
jgi:large subunit ribosomal protein L28e